MQEMFADLHVHIGRSEKGKPIKITAASTNIKDKITIRTANTMKKVLEICKR